MKNCVSFTFLKEKKSDYLTKCPDDMIGEILKFLSIDDQMKLSVTNKILNRSVNGRLDFQQVDAYVLNLNHKIESIRTDIRSRPERRLEMNQVYIEHGPQIHPAARASFGAFFKDITSTFTQFLDERSEKKELKKQTMKIERLELVRDSFISKQQKTR